MHDALDVIGDRWILFILLGAMSGTAHFEDFQSKLGIARNILSNRLARLVQLDILTRHVMESDKRKIEYRLTQKGWDLASTLLVLRQWAERWAENGPLSTKVVDRRDRLPIRELKLHAHDGRLLESRDILWLNNKGEEIIYIGDALCQGDDTV